jgi:predicted nucleic acid-binding protein
MNHFALDASVLVKRYHNEPGAKVMQELTDALLANEPRCALISWSTLAETLAALNRKRNAEIISQSIYQAVKTRLLLEAREMNVLSVTDTTIRDSLGLIEHHNINASDALFLRQVLDWQAQLPEGDNVVVVAADHRLLRAAEAEGLAMLDPEQSKVTEVKSFLVPTPDDRT